MSYEPDSFPCMGAHRYPSPYTQFFLGRDGNWEGSSSDEASSHWIFLNAVCVSRGPAYRRKKQQICAYSVLVEKSSSHDLVREKRGAGCSHGSGF